MTRPLIFLTSSSLGTNFLSPQHAVKTFAHMKYLLSNQLVIHIPCRYSIPVRLQIIIFISGLRLALHCHGEIVYPVN